MDPSVILNQLYELGFRVDDSEDVGYTFSFEGLNLLYTPDQEDDRYLSIMAPGIYRIEEPNERKYILEVMNEVNRRVKYAKIYAYNDFLIVSYEGYVSDDDNLEDKLRTAILSIMASNERFCRIINGDEPFECERDSVQTNDSDSDYNGDDDDDNDLDNLSDEELDSLLDGFLTQKDNRDDVIDGFDVDEPDDADGDDVPSDADGDESDDENDDDKENQQ